MSTQACILAESLCISAPVEQVWIYINNSKISFLYSPWVLDSQRHSALASFYRGLNQTSYTLLNTVLQIFKVFPSYIHCCVFIRKQTKTLANNLSQVYGFLSPEKMIYFGFKIKKYTHVYYCLRIKEGRGKEKTILGRNCIYLELSALKHLKKTSLLFCGMTFLLIWGVLLPFNVQTYKKVERIEELYSECTHHPPIFYSLYFTIFALSHIHLYIHLSVPQSILIFYAF